MNPFHSLTAPFLFYRFVTCCFITLCNCQLPAQPKSCRTTSCRLSVIACSIYFQVSSTSRGQISCVCWIVSKLRQQHVNSFVCYRVEVWILKRIGRARCSRNGQCEAMVWWLHSRPYFSLPLTLVHGDDSSRLIFLKMIIAWRLPSPSVKSAHIIPHPPPPPPTRQWFTAITACEIQ